MGKAKCFLKNGDCLLQKTENEACRRIVVKEKNEEEKEEAEQTKSEGIFFPKRTDDAKKSYSRCHKSDSQDNRILKIVTPGLEKRFKVAAIEDAPVEKKAFEKHDIRCRTKLFVVEKCLLREKFIDICILDSCALGQKEVQIGDQPV